MKKLMILALVLCILMVGCDRSSPLGQAAGGKPGKPTTEPSTVNECGDHLDNDGDGFCDYDWSKGYCLDGSTLGDLDCAQKKDTSETGDPTVEKCDGIDNDGDGIIDEENICPTISYYCDEDLDGFFGGTIIGTCNTFDCAPSNCGSIIGDDCNDNNTNINPGVRESCDSDGIDNDCDGEIDECTCLNGIVDGDETDIDCGGSCPGCSLEEHCMESSDCTSGYCFKSGWEGLWKCTEPVECTELYPGLNDASADRVNVVFYGLYFTSVEDFVHLLKIGVDYYSEYDSIWSRDYPGLLELEAYKDNKDKFNFWYFNVIFDHGSQTPNCRDLTSAYNVYIMNTTGRSNARFGGWSNVYFSSNWPASFLHEFQHQFPMLADEYVESSLGDLHRYPNCAHSLSEAKKWWGDLEGQFDGGYSFLNRTVGYYDGCSYVYGNYRPTEYSLMKNLKPWIGTVNARHVRERLTEYTGTTSNDGNALEVTLVGEPTDINSYTVKEVKPLSFSNEVKKDKNKPYKLKVKAGNVIFSQNFDTKDILIEEDLSKEDIKGLYKEIPKEEVKVIVPLGKAKFDPETWTIDLPWESQAEFAEDEQKTVNIGKKKIPKKLVAFSISIEEGQPTTI